jgi:phosphoglycolate phosphatase-like HAD superfamily hydrolase
MKPFEGIHAISFDGDGTLWDFQKVMQQALRHTLQALETFDHEAAAQLTVDRMIRIRQRVAAQLKGVETNLETIRLEAFRHTLHEVGDPTTR